MRLTCFYAAIALLLLATLPAPAQENTLAKVLAGKAIPLSLTLKQLDGNWRVITPAPTADAAEALVRMIVMQMSQRTWVPEVMYTHGETLVIAGETYLLAYARPPRPLLAPGGGNRQEVKTEPELLTPESEIDLTLLNIRTMGNLLDIHPFELKRTLADSQTPPMTMKERQTQSLNNLRQLAIASLSYAQDHNEVMPPTDTYEHWKASLGLHGDKKVFLQPGSGEPYLPNPALNNKALGELAHPEQVVVAYEQHPWPDGKRIVAFCDGHVEMVDDQRWQQLQATMTPAH